METFHDQGNFPVVQAVDSVGFISGNKTMQVFHVEVFPIVGIPQHKCCRINSLQNFHGFPCPRTRSFLYVVQKISLATAMLLKTNVLLLFLDSSECLANFADTLLYVWRPRMDSKKKRKVFPLAPLSTRETVNAKSADFLTC